MGELVHMPEFWAGVAGVSRSEARRVIHQGGQRIDGKVSQDLDVHWSKVVNGKPSLGGRCGCVMEMAGCVCRDEPTDPNYSSVSDSRAGENSQGAKPK